MRIAFKFIFCCTLFCFANFVFAIPPNASYKIDNLFLKYANHYIDSFYFPSNPTIAVQMGMHFYDDKLEDFSKAAVVRNIADLKDFERNLLSFDPAPLSATIKGDRALILNHRSEERRVGKV